MFACLAYRSPFIVFIIVLRWVGHILYTIASILLKLLGVILKVVGSYVQVCLQRCEVTVLELN